MKIKTPGKIPIVSHNKSTNLKGMINWFAFASKIYCVSRLVRAYKVPPKYTPGGLRRKAKESQIGAAVPKLKKSLTPGTIVIILKGHYAVSIFLHILCCNNRYHNILFSK